MQQEKAPTKQERAPASYDCLGRSRGEQEKKPGASALRRADRTHGAKLTMNSVLSSAATAAVAAWASSVTKPKPRERPVSRSLGMKASSTLP